MRNYVSLKKTIRKCTYSIIRSHINCYSSSSIVSLENTCIVVFVLLVWVKRAPSLVVFPLLTPCTFSSTFVICFSWRPKFFTPSKTWPSCLVLDDRWHVRLSLNLFPPRLVWQRFYENKLCLLHRFYPQFWMQKFNCSISSVQFRAFYGVSTRNFTDISSSTITLG